MKHYRKVRESILKLDSLHQTLCVESNLLRMVLHHFHNLDYNTIKSDKHMYLYISHDFFQQIALILYISFRIYFLKCIHVIKLPLLYEAHLN